MPSFKVTALAAAAAALFAGVNAGVMMASGEFNSTGYDGMISCVKGTGKAFDVAIDDGTTVIVPKTTFDLDNADSDIGDCLDEYTSFLDVAVDVGRDNLDDLPIVSSDEATADWAQANGAQGISLEDDGNDDIQKRSGTLSARHVKYFLCETTTADNTCLGSHHNEPINQCLTYNDITWKSVKFGNADDKVKMRMHVYKDQGCPGYRTLRVITLPPGHLKCMQGPIRSYNAFFINKDGKAIN